MKAWKVVVLVTIFVYIAAQISSSLLSDASKNPIADKIAGNRPDAGRVDSLNENAPIRGHSS